jgi:hypothetical protein
MFRDRLRRNVVLLIGFGGLDPVVHASLQEIMREVRERADPAESEPRIYVIDRQPDTLSLRMLVDAGKGLGGAGSVVQVGVRGVQLHHAILVLYCLLVSRRLEALSAQEGRRLWLPADRRTFLYTIAVAGPLMTRWTAELLQRTRALEIGLHAILSQGSPEAYIPLSALHSRLRRAYELRADLVRVLNLDSHAQFDQHGFLRGKVDARAYVPVGLRKEELQEAMQVGAAEDLKRRLPVPRGYSPVIVGEDLTAYSLDSGREVQIAA